MSSRTRNSLLNISSGLIGQVVFLLTSFGVRTVFIYVLGATYLGISGLFGNILSLLSLAELGFGQAIIFALYKPIAENNEEKIGALMGLFKRVYFWMFVIISILGLALTPFLEFFVKQPVEIPHFQLIYTLYVISTSSSYLFSYRKSLLFATQKNYVSTNITTKFYIAGAIFQILVLLLWRNFILYLLVQILNTLIQDIYISYKTNRLFPGIHRRENNRLPDADRKGIIKNVKALVIYKIGTLSLNSTDNLIISRFVGLLQVGYYSNYWLLCTSVSGILSTIFSNLTASIGNLNATESKEKQLQVFFNINTTTFWFYGIACLCLSTCMTPFIRLWIGEKYVLSTATTFIIAFNQYIAGMLYSPFNYRQTLGLFVQGKLRPVISAVLNVGLSIVLAIYFGLPGVLWGTAITRLVTNVWYDPYVVFKRGLQTSPKKYFIDYIYKMIVYVATAIACDLIVSRIQLSPFINLLLTLVTTLIIGVGSFYIFFGRNEGTIYLFNTLKNSINILKAK
ncbi:MAG: sugar translocase [Bacteroides sp.]|nr:sugar translocase [Bacteroides sp.]